MKVFKMILNGIAWGCTICTFVLMIGTAAVGDSFLAVTANDFIRQAIGSMIVGMGFTVPSLVYSNENLNLGMKTFIHMGIGLFIYFLVALNLHWIPIDFGWKMTVISVFIAIVVSFGFWFLFYLYNRMEAKKLNRKLESMK